MEILFYPDTGCFLQGSQMVLTYFDENTQTENQRKYRKSTDRWSPRYTSRPKRDVFISGLIPDCLKSKKSVRLPISTITQVSQRIGWRNGRTHCGTNIMQGLPILNRSCSEKQAFLWSPHLIGYQLLSLEHGCRRAKADQDFDGGIPCGSIFPDPD